ncbi:MAG: ATP synthase F1 subunit epsilon [Lachnospiraceae bacterium]|nr:ATP synthase F1 subunit epsilon [Lachnospiraceae bacterium]MDE6743319.1 ATP synthase F1 subunit epsilon [Lachnospiraceae bacterium]
MADNTFLLKIITPERLFFEGEAEMVEFNTTEGQIGIYKNHVPTTVIISPGILTITMPNEEKEAALHAGFVEILQNQVTILAEAIEWPGEIDENRAKSAKERAERRLQAKEAGIDEDRAQIALMRALTRIQTIK